MLDVGVSNDILMRVGKGRRKNMEICTLVLLER